MESYEDLTQKVEEAQMERDIALGGGQDTRVELEKKIEEMKQAQKKVEAALEESEKKAAKREEELKDKEVELITIRKEKVVLSQELADAKRREAQLTECAAPVAQDYEDLHTMHK